MTVPRPERSLLTRELPLVRPPPYDTRHATRCGRLPTARELRPFRPAAKPRWSPSRREQQRISGTSRFQNPSRCELRSAWDLGQIRVNFSYDNHMSTSAEFCDKPGRQQFLEGPHEMHWKQWLWLNANCTDFQFQPIEATFHDEHGFTTRATWDVGIELVTGPLVFAEIKANRSFFLMPKVSMSINASVHALKSRDAVFARLTGTDFHPLTLATIQQVYSHRRVDYNYEAEARAMLAAIADNGSKTTLGWAKRFLGGHAPEAEAKICSMAMDRLIALDVGLPLTDETKLSFAPVNQNEGKLRSFLAQFGEAQ